jgi:putative transcriptional regulator
MPVNNQHSGLPIAALRRRLNMTQEEFAHAIGVTVSTVNRWENGHIEPSRLARRAMETLAGQVTTSSEDHEEVSEALSAKAS